MSDDPIKALILRTQRPPDFDSAFQRDVWARIASAESRGVRGWFERVSSAAAAWVVRPAGVVGLFVATALAGVALARMAGAAETGHFAKEEHYLRSISPMAQAYGHGRP